MLIRRIPVVVWFRWLVTTPVTPLWWLLKLLHLLIRYPADWLDWTARRVDYWRFAVRWNRMDWVWKGREQIRDKLDEE